MNVDIANMVNDLIYKTDWIEHIITCFSVFVGALFAYRFGLKLEMRKAKRQMRGDFCALYSQMWWNFDEKLEYKRNVLEKLKSAYEKRDAEAMCIIVRGPIVSFNFDMDKYIFMNDCNRCFIPELKIVQSTHENLRFLWDNYNQCLVQARQQYAHGCMNVFEEMQKTFLSNYNLYNKMCTRLYYLNKHLDRCYERFFNVYYYDNMEDDLKTKDKLEHYVPGALLDEEFIKQDEYFNKFWAPDYTLWESIKYHYRKLKYHLKGLKIYFFGRGKPKTKHKSKGKK